MTRFRFSLLLLGLFLLGLPLAPSSGAQPASPQPVATPAPAAHVLPFASKGNRVELAVSQNGGVSQTGGLAAGGSVLAVEAQDVPGWLAFERALVPLGEASEAAFDFDVLPHAPVGQVARLRFVAFAEGGRVVGERVIAVEVAAPAELSVAGPAPNPSRGSARMSVTLPQPARLSVRLYDGLGRQVAVLADDAYPAGAHEVEWDGSGLAAGVYLWRLDAHAEAGRQVRQGTLVRLR